MFLGSAEEAVFTVTDRGAFKLIKNGYTYTKSTNTKRKSDYISWRCSLMKNHRYICKAKARTKKIGSIERVRFYDEHSHEPN